MADFDNDGFLDLIIIRRGDLIHENESLIFLNKGTSGFEQLKNHNIISSELGAIGLGVETFDYNQDGIVDVIIGNERGKWHLFKNSMKAALENNYVVVEVGSSPKEKATGLGAFVTIKSCGHKQVKRVGVTGANYSLSFNHFVHFGLGECEELINVKVVWTNGETSEKTIYSRNINELIGRVN